LFFFEIIISLEIVFGIKFSTSSLTQLKAKIKLVENCMNIIKPIVTLNHSKRKRRQLRNFIKLKKT